MKKTVAFTLLAVLFLLLGTSVQAEMYPVVFQGSVGEDIPYQKTIEAVAFGNGTVYAACDYRMQAGKELIGIYYLGLMGAYSTNGSKLWVNGSGYVVKIQPVGDGVLAGSLGGFVFFDKDGHIVANAPTINKLYDFVVGDGYVYGVDGDVWYSNGTYSSSGEVFKAKLYENGSVALYKTGWVLNLTSMPSRVRLGDVVYVGSGMPSGYSTGYRFGAVYGVSYDGKLLWTIRTGDWVRDLEVWDGKAVAGVGSNDGRGRILLVDESGKVLWNESAFSIDDLLVSGNTLYASGIDEDGRGRVAAYDLGKKKKLWEITLPYRAKVLAYGDGKLAVGIGKFESRKEGNVTKVYSEGGLYVLDPKNGKTLWKSTDFGYVRSLAVSGNLLAAGTASSYFYVVDLDKIRSSSGICGPGIFLLTILLSMAVVKGGGGGAS
ncbi:quinoprotein dehydrogenase [Thermococcus profundus]|uniref:Quinoprotein dehydrogenase n=1 Tax=Thermococcus profundus TaxID=49899 RepID=A0A2Z2MD86_THEPR|nr:PQQ-binding-like beta-propeller repeat protein [Thermococcus profundus]ASJ02575.1 quinoprotein dehydrogenase [Thermococcus profundus]